MNALLVIIFIATLIYLSTSVNIKTYVNIIALQGALLFFVAIFELKEFEVFHMIFILFETLIFKAIIVPIILYRISKKNSLINLKNFSVRRKNKGFNMVIASSIIIALTFVLAYDLHEEHLEVKYFAAALSAIIIGLLFIIINKNIVIHIISYLVIENGIFLMALAVGSEMPLIINSAILMDIFASVLVLGIFFNKIGEHYDTFESDQLNTLKD